MWGGSLFDFLISFKPLQKSAKQPANKNNASGAHDNLLRRDLFTDDKDKQHPVGPASGLGCS